jgi:NAD(P)-dependent dehydrogenase (short-subunit alcohol dehydrogenase family)
MDEPLPDFHRLDGVAAVVTGGAAGIGYGIARRLAQADALVAITDIHETALEGAVGRLERSGASVIAMPPTWQIPTAPGRSSTGR